MSNLYPRSKDNAESFVDYSTMLEVVNEIINYKGELSKNEKDIYRQRELDNFQVVIQRLMESESFKDKVGFIK